MKRVSIYTRLLIAFFIFIIAGLLIKGGRGIEFKETVFSGFLVVSSFVFGIIIAFSIANRHARLSSIRQSLREQDAILLNIYLLSETFDKRIIGAVREKIDNLLISQIDYKLIDFDKESPKKLKILYVFLEKLKTKTKNQEESKDKILDNAMELEKICKEVDYQIRNGMMFYEWISLLVLGGIILFCLFYVNDGSFISVLVVAFLSTSLVLLLLVLYDLDTLLWQERNWIWEPLSALFVELDLIPYFPEPVIKRINLKKIEDLKKIRIAIYPKPYPDMSGKKVRVVKLNS